jgi:muramoyltetrapeptide carboxypeptidase
MNPAPDSLPLIKPPRLSKGDVVSIVAPASAPPDPAAIDRSVVALEKLGFVPKLGTHVRKRNGFLAGTDAERVADLMDAFVDPSVKAIVCLRGGYGTARLLPLLDYSLIRQNAKVLVGYSDITTLHCALLVRAGLVSFHGPMLNSEIAGNAPSFAIESLLRTVMKAEPVGGIRQGYEGPAPLIVRGGVAQGPLVGGNLSVLCTTLGTRFQPEFKGRILFLEDVGERPYRIDRMLTHLLNAGLLQQAAGVAVGLNKDCEDPKAADAGEYRQTLEDVLRERLEGLGVPVVAGLPFGHVPFNATLPVGIRATLDAERGDLVFEEAAVV